MKNRIGLRIVAIILLCLSIGVHLHAQCLPCNIKPGLHLNTAVLEFKHSGELMSYPPELLQTIDSLSVRVNVDDLFWDSRRSTYISSYLTTIANIQLIRSDYNNVILKYGITEADLIAVETEIAYELYRYIRNSDIDNPHKDYYRAKISLLGYPEVNNSPTTYVPDLTELIDPEFTITYRFYNENNNRINSDSKLFCADGNCVDRLVRCQRACNESTANTSAYFISGRMAIPAGTRQVQYELRLRNSKTQTIVTHQRAFPTSFQGLLNQVRSTLTPSIEAAYIKIQAGAEKLKTNPSDTTVPAATLTTAANAMISTLETIVTNLNADNPTGEWFLHNLWLSGKLVINPMAGSGASFTKATADEKAKYEVFELMVKNGSFQVENIDNFETRFDDIPKIKAKINAEGTAKDVEPVYDDDFLYDGKLYVSSGASDSAIMRHHDVLTDYFIMHANPKREINERQRLYVLAENKPPGLKLVTSTTAIALTDEGTLLKSIAGLADVGILAFDGTGVEDTPVAIFLRRAKRLESIMKAFREINVKPDLPFIFEKDKSAKYVTDLLEHDYLQEPPVFIEYPIKAVAADNTEKEVKKGTYRINKFYRLRFKTGIVYSLLEKRDFTYSGNNTFTLTNSRYGIDGTFGLQFYFKKQDIRHMKAPLFLYSGLSMKAIKENFYLGFGIEPTSGIALTGICHIGKREALTGVNGVPTGTKDVAGVAVGAAILIDANLFVKLFSWGNSNKAIAGF